MANFGETDELRVESESVVTGERTTSSVKKSELDTEAESIRIVPMTATGDPGTEVEAQLSPDSTIFIEDACSFLGVARWVLPVPGPPIITMLWASAMKSHRCSELSSASSDHNGVPHRVPEKRTRVHGVDSAKHPLIFGISRDQPGSGGIGALF